jgi:hypothetical protein
MKYRGESEVECLVSFVQFPSMYSVFQISYLDLESVRAAESSPLKMCLDFILRYTQCDSTQSIADIFFRGKNQLPAGKVAF